MKNKKMVATLASLCLIVVAVVAAVVGVLAAVTQSVTGTFSVQYYAMNVSATLQLKSWGPQKSDNTRSFSQFDGTSGHEVTTSFKPSQNTTTGTLTSGVTYDFGWEDDQGAANKDFYGYALYEIAIANTSTINSMTVTVGAPTDGTGAKSYVYYSTTQLTSPSYSTLTANWGTDGATSTPTFESATAYSAALTVTAGSSVYLYVVVTINDLDVAIGSSSAGVDSTVVITLASVAAQQPQG